MFRLVGITYNDFPLIQNCIESVYDFVDEIVIVDGRYVDFPGESDFSTDGTLEYLKSIDKVNLILAPGLQEIEKRNLYLTGSEGDWYLMLDADETWEGPPPQLEPDIDVYILKEKRDYPIHEMQRVKIFKHVPGIHYEGKHYWLRDAEGSTLCVVGRAGKKYKWKFIKHSQIYHHELDRSQERIRDKKLYYAVLRGRESKIQEHL